MKKCWLLLLMILLFSGCSDSSILDTVVDKSGLLSAEEIIALQEYNADLLKEHDIDFRLILEDGNLNVAAFNFRANTLMTELAGQTKKRSQGN